MADPNAVVESFAYVLILLFCMLIAGQAFRSIKWMIDRMREYEEMDKEDERYV
jgi:hypothetical protein